MSLLIFCVSGAAGVTKMEGGDGSFKSLHVLVLCIVSIALFLLLLLPAFVCDDIFAVAAAAATGGAVRDDADSM
tara:strand:- start:436 stop:657 length:222 start_codon:yes stop_codon:yes gene_type:complete